MAENVMPDADENEPRPLDMSGVQDRTKAMLDPELIFTWNGYMVDITALAVRSMSEITVALGRGNGVPTILALHDVPNEPENVAAQPVIAKGPNTVSVKTYPQTGDVRVDMRRFLLMRRFVIPHGHRAYVPVVRRTLPKIGDSLVFLFSKARFVPIEPQRTKRKQNGGTANQAASGPTTPAPAPAPSPEKPKDDAASA